MAANLKPLVSAIVPVFNGESFIAEAIDSVLAQSYRSWELILVDDGSTDDSLLIAADYTARHTETIRLLRHPEGKHLGTAATRNLGIEHARGEFIANLDQDDVWKSSKLDEQVRIFQENPSAAMTFGPMILWSSWDDFSGTKADRVQSFSFKANALFSPPDFLPLLLCGKNDPHGYLVRKTAIVSVGGYEENLGICEDWGLYAKIALKHNIYVSSKSNYYYRQHQGQSCRIVRKEGNFFAGWQPFLAWLPKYLDQCGCSEPVISRALQTANRRNRVYRMQESVTHTVRRWIGSIAGRTG